MLGRHHAITGAVTGVAVACVVGANEDSTVLAGVLGALAALGPDIDEPQSLIGRRFGLGVATLAGGAWLVMNGIAPLLTTVGLQAFGTVVLIALVIGTLIPLTIKATFGHRGAVHHPLLGLMWWVLAGGLLLGYGTTIGVWWALGWTAHLLGDACTVSGIPGLVLDDERDERQERQPAAHNKRPVERPFAVRGKRRRGRRSRWWALPPEWRFRTGSRTETVVVWLWIASAVVVGVGSTVARMMFLT